MVLNEGFLIFNLNSKTVCHRRRQRASDFPEMTCDKCFYYRSFSLSPWQGARHWSSFRAFEQTLARTVQRFYVPKADVVAQGYDLSLNRYKEVVHEEVTHRKPDEIMKSLHELEAEIQRGMKELKGMLK